MTVHNSGFTIIELLVVITILLIGTSTALPNLRSIGQNNGVKSDARDLKNTFFTTRMEAIKRNRSVTIVFNHKGHDYTAFVDENNSCELDAGIDSVICNGSFSCCSLDNSQGGDDGLSFVANDDDEPALRWDNKGYPHNNGGGFGAGTAYLAREDARYCVIVSKTGNVRIKSY
jgi:prepilin-type N-terminal cleavage/methylation domain-containing protein